MSTKKLQVIGLKGEDGVGISSMKQTKTSTESGGENVYEFTLTDESKAEFKVKNGTSGVYVGSGDMPEGYNVQIDPEGEVPNFVTREEFSKLQKEINDLRTEIGLEISEVASLLGGDA